MTAFVPARDGLGRAPPAFYNPAERGPPRPPEESAMACLTAARAG